MNYWIAPSFYIEELTEETKKQKDESVMLKVCNYYGITLKQLTGNSRTRNCVMPRQIISYIFREIFNYGLEDIGKIINRDHSCVVYNVKNVKNYMDVDKVFKVTVNKLCNFAKFYTPIKKERQLLKGKTSQYKGVSYHKDSQRWRATIYLGNGEYKHLGTFKNELDAFEAYTKEKNK